MSFHDWGVVVPDTVTQIKEDEAGAFALGADIRALRKGRGLTLEALAEQLGKSVGFLSQVERGLSTPSLDDLRAIAQLFDIPLSFFLAPHAAAPEEAGLILRQENRRQIGDEHNLSEELLSPIYLGLLKCCVRCLHRMPNHMRSYHVRQRNQVSL